MREDQKVLIQLRDMWKARAEQAEVERDELKAEVKSLFDDNFKLIEEKEELKAEVEQYKTHAKEEMLRCREYMTEWETVTEHNNELAHKNGELNHKLDELKAEVERLTEYLDWEVIDWRKGFETMQKWKSQAGGGE